MSSTPDPWRFAAMAAVVAMAAVIVVGAGYLDLSPEAATASLTACVAAVVALARRYGGAAAVFFAAGVSSLAGPLLGW